MNKAKRCTNIGMVVVGILISVSCFSQNPVPEARLPVTVIDSLRKTVLDSLRQSEDTVLRIRNLNPYFTLHVDSTMNYALELNKNPSHYFWYLKNSPLGLKINKDNGLLSFKADKSYFLSGRLKYDYPYKITIGVQNLHDPNERLDTSFTILFFTTDIIPSHLKPTVNSTLYIEEGDTVNFKVECEEGSFPVESISFYSNVPLKNYTIVKKCDDDFIWSPPFDFIKDTDSGKQKLVLLNFVGINKFYAKDTAVVKIYVKDAINYPVMLQEYQRTVKSVTMYILQLKYAFVQLDKKVKSTKSTRTTFDLTTASSALGGTVFSSASSPSAQNTGRILPSAGVALVPVKEAVAPTKTAEQNSASLVRSSIKRLEYQLHENSLSGERDIDIIKKITTLKSEMKQIQIQLIEVPIDENSNMTEEQLNEYFNSKKVSKKYKLKAH
ncbi:MAG: hypothetical protein Q8918_18185 [Bacteroidota bacterium]|nr:hypothetical protein [Bacteroidota bacterium]MDP4213999.1 hypothetical protein [Bacteroidota bacterium]MDP4252034.1 hypothetical protein [Bacteroidota bacterium]